MSLLRLSVFAFNFCLESISCPIRGTICRVVQLLLVDPDGPWLSEVKFNEEHEI